MFWQKGNKLGILAFLMFVTGQVSGQEKVMTVGMQFKPVFSAPLFGTGPVQVSDSGYQYVFTPRGGYSAGMIIRKGYTKNLSIEFGINFAARNYRLKADGPLGNLASGFKIIGYEIPFSQLVFIRIGEKLFMNASGGLCINMFPSDVVKYGDNLMVYAGRELIFNPSLIANVGFEYRTERSGYFYLGSSLNRPFFNIYTAAASVESNYVVLSKVRTGLKGTYLTVDLRYFFHEDPQRKIRKAKSKS